MRRWTTALWLTLLFACHPDPGDPLYPDPTAAGDSGGPGIPGGPEPYEEGDARLAVGLFYEGGYSEIIPIDDAVSHYYIYSNTFSQSADTSILVEGRESAKLTHGSQGWFGGGLTWDVAQDLSAWTTLHVSMRSRSADLEDTNIHMSSNGGAQEGVVASADYGFIADGAWHHLSIPLSDFQGEGVVLSAISGPFVFVGAGGSEGSELWFDNLYFTAE